ncbi:RBBP9/YdeN family alpha/beta hydrolase [Sphingomonas dokdonensis]|uniref:RBBP9/YdeN family alpha/beta hydrolase n=1 Tax=Sphingomonas dokdonensis TaxID=344880 RepID=UPI001FE7EC20|nr:alpha/beta hydrolase [Sphingomonas dokdonensis]
MWDRPHRNSWITKLGAAIAQAKAPVILVGQSLCCQAIAWWASLSPQPQGWPGAGTLPVAPADVDWPSAAAELGTFAPATRLPLPLPSILVASANDPWIELESARSLASSWGSHFVDAGPLGHVDAASGLGWWPYGQKLLERAIFATGGAHGEVRSPADARAVLACPAVAEEE